MNTNNQILAETREQLIKDGYKPLIEEKIGRAHV